jgi:hypothetical protein
MHKKKLDVLAPLAPFCANSHASGYMGVPGFIFAVSCLLFMLLLHF